MSKTNHYSDEYVDALHKEIERYTKAIRLSRECLEAVRTCSLEREIVQSAESGLDAVNAIVAQSQQEDVATK